VSAHDLQHKCPLVAGKDGEKRERHEQVKKRADKKTSPRGGPSLGSPLSGGHDGVHHLDDPVQRRVGADGHVGAAEVVVDGADHADDVELRVDAGRLLVDQT